MMIGFGNAQHLTYDEKKRKLEHIQKISSKIKAKKTFQRAKSKRKKKGKKTHR